MHGAAGHFSPLRLLSPSGVFLLGSLPVRRASLLGVVVLVAPGPRCLRFAVDDGTGCFSCILWHSPDAAREPESAQPTLGDLVRVCGSLSRSAFNGAVELTVTALAFESDTNVEVLFWLDVVTQAGMQPP